MDDVGVGRLSHRSKPAAEVRGRAGLAASTTTSSDANPPSGITPTDVAATFPLNASGDLDNVEIKKSSVPGVGLGLFATKFIKKNSRNTKFSGKLITAEEAEASKSS